MFLYNLVYLRIFVRSSLFFNLDLDTIRNMKFEKLETFERNVKDSFPNHLSPIYLIVSPQEGERKKILGSLTTLWEKECDLQRSPNLLSALFHVRSGSLFSQKMAAVFETNEILTKDEIKALIEYAKQPSPVGYLLLALSSAKQAKELYQKGKQEVVFLDLSSEKPWEEESRRKKWIVQKVIASKKKISPQAVELLAASFPANRLLLDQELNKLLCYLGERETIEQNDVIALCSPISEQNLFHMARDLVWRRFSKVPSRCELSLLLPLVGQLRYQLELGLKMISSIQRGEGQEQMAKRFAMLRPKALAEYAQVVRARKQAFFKEGLKRLFALEYGIKTSRSKPEVLFTQFCAHMEGMKR